MKKDIVAIGAHPDDVELGCGGTLAKMLSLGKTAAIIDLTEGELGTRGSRELRYEEAAAASKILGVTQRHNLQLPDGFLENIREYQMPIIRLIRHYKPDFVFANAIDDRHPDHAKAAKLTADACFLAGLRKIETEYEGQPQEAWRPKHVFHYIQWKNLQPDFCVDISDFMEVKLAACLAYASQFYDPNSTEPLTPIATQDFKESLTYRAQDLGRLSGCTYAEGFTSHRLLAVENFDSFVL